MIQKLESIGASSLMQETFPPIHWYVEDLLSQGCFILASLPKTGKSLLCLSLGLAITSEKPFLGTFTTHQAGVCILAVEDRLRRIQDRLWKITDEASEDLRFVERAENLDNGLLKQLKLDLTDFPNTKVYVIDTYAAIRTPGADYAYQNDYDDLSKFADFADENDVCVIVCHHCRKSVSTISPFLDISGTTGLTGAVTGMIVLHNSESDPDTTIMSVEGKDVAEAHFKLELENCVWRLIEPVSRDELIASKIPDCIHTTIDFISKRQEPWSGSSAELIHDIGLQDIRPDVYGKFLAQHRDYMSRHGVAYERQHTRTGNILNLTSISVDNQPS